MHGEYCRDLNGEACELRSKEKKKASLEIKIGKHKKFCSVMLYKPSKQENITGFAREFRDGRFGEHLGSLIEESRRKAVFQTSLIFRREPYWVLDGVARSCYF